jgi:hypothetical protein
MLASVDGDGDMSADESTISKFSAEGNKGLKTFVILE